jgi:hypothetical protein
MILDLWLNSDHTSKITAPRVGVVPGWVAPGESIGGRRAASAKLARSADRQYGQVAQLVRATA